MRFMILVKATADTELYELGDFVQGEAVERFREMGMGGDV